MFRDMRRKKQALSRQEADEILDRQTHGVLALAEEGDYPYAVPLSYVRSGSTLYFHCAKTGHKLDCIRSNPKASFCVVDQDQVLPSRYTTAFRSVIAFGTVEIMEDEAQKREAIELLARKYAPDDDQENRRRYIERDWKPLCMLKMLIEHITAKEAIELVRQKTCI